jgi:hypothetical protein
LSKHGRTNSTPPLVSPLEAQPELGIDLSVERPDESEWAKLLSSIRPLLDDLKLSEVVETIDHLDVSFLASDCASTIEDTMRVLLSARLRAVTHYSGRCILCLPPPVRVLDFAESASRRKPKLYAH